MAQIFGYCTFCDYIYEAQTLMQECPKCFSRKETPSSEWLRNMSAHEDRICNGITAGNMKPIEKEINLKEERMFKWFGYDHLPEGKARNTSMLFHNLANEVCNYLDPGPERTVALRKLLEAKDAAVRAAVYPGG